MGDSSVIVERLPLLIQLRPVERLHKAATYSAQHLLLGLLCGSIHCIVGPILVGLDLNGLRLADQSVERLESLLASFAQQLALLASLLERR